MFDAGLVETAQAHHLELVQYTESFLGPFHEAYAMEAIMGDNNWMIRYNFRIKLCNNCQTDLLNFVPFISHNFLAFPHKLC